VKQRGFAGAGGADDGEKFALWNVEINTAQSFDGDFAGVIHLAQLAHMNDGAIHRQEPQWGPDGPRSSRDRLRRVSPMRGRWRARWATSREPRPAAAIRVRIYEVPLARQN